MFFIRPVVTEKTSENDKNSIYTFYVCISCNKIQIKEKINKVFGCSVKSIRTMIYYRKNKSKYTKKGLLYGKTNKLKKAIIQLEENQKISFSKEKEI
ncbi:50S ribosomal protein L23 [Blattabacterium cuenoti]|uniref:50S ribosomal protein L23 n=1 Tax=Blattabacterium cuenoti TaxID=1653831 RepID=UPI00163C1635|nr:50S ribosomal protein L23 [Blattabacterium cuenoti]